MANAVRVYAACSSLGGTAGKLMLDAPFSPDFHAVASEANVEDRR